MTTQQTTVPQAEVPSVGKLLTATGIALVAAIVILIAFVLPAEYGIDPLGTGRALRLTDLANASEKPSSPAATPPVQSAAATEAAPAVTSINPELVPSPKGDAP